MTEQSGKKANVYLVKLDGDDLLVSLGYCPPTSVDNGRVPSESVQVLDRLTVPMDLLPGLVKQMVAVAVHYQQENGGNTFTLSESDGVRTVSL